MRHNLGTPPTDAGRAEQTERLAELLDGCATLLLASRRIELDAALDPTDLADELERDAERLLRRRR